MRATVNRPESLKKCLQAIRPALYHHAQGLDVPEGITVHEWLGLMLPAVVKNPEKWLEPLERVGGHEIYLISTWLTLPTMSLTRLNMLAIAIARTYRSLYQSGLRMVVSVRGTKKQTGDVGVGDGAPEIKD